jgi:hypothetical protein
VEDLKVNYKRMNDEELEVLSKLYKFNYVVLEKTAQTDFQVLWGTENFKLVQIN